MKFPKNSEIELTDKLRKAFSSEIGELISLSKLSEMIVSKDTIPKAIRKNYAFKKFTTEKMEDIVREKLTGKNRELGLNAIDTYREIKGYNIKGRIQNQAEIDLIESLREVFSSELCRSISISGLSDIIASKRFIGKCLARKGKFTRYSINKIKLAVENYLTKFNQEKALDAIDEYSIIKGYKSEGIASNQPELDLVEALQEAFSTQEGEYISLAKLSRMVGTGNLIARNLREKFSFRKDTIDKWENLAQEKLKEAYIEAALNAIDDYRRLKRYKVVHPISRHPDPIVSNNYLGKLIKFPKLNEFLLGIINVGPPSNVFKNFDSQPRISKFRIKGISSKDREQIVRKLKIDGSLKEIFFKSRNKIKKEIIKSNDINHLLYDLMGYAQPNLYKDEDLSTYSSLPTHEAITTKIVENYENCIGIEIPIWKLIGMELFLTGHPDILLIWNDILLIADYKPSQLTSKVTLRRKFFHSLPQIISYGVLFKRKFDIRNILCITFNHFKAWIYDPEFLLKKLKRILLKYNKNVKMPWNSYLD